MSKINILSALTLFALSVQTPANAQGSDYTPPNRGGDQYQDSAPRSIAPPRDRGPSDPSPSYGQPYAPPPPANDRPRESYDTRPDGPPSYEDTYTSSEIVDAGHKFFGSVSEGFARVVEHAFQKQGRPNGYILGEEAGAAIIAGLRYGEGVLHTKNFGTRKVYWQGPSIGYDFGGDGSKTVTLIYNLRDPSQLFERFAGVEGSAYLIGGVGITFLTHENVTCAPIRSGLGLRLGANVGYLKYTPSATWNPF